MEISGSYTLYAPRERVWAHILDPKILARIVPGCEELEQQGPERLRGRIRIGVASVKGVYDGTLDILERSEPTHCRIRVDGKGTTGTMYGEGHITLEARNLNTTTVTYQGQAELGGPIVSVGARMLNAAARMLINQGFARLANTLAESEPAPGATPQVALNPAPAVAVPMTRSASGMAEVTWSTVLPEARPLASEQAPAEALPLEQAASPQPAPGSQRSAISPAVPAPLASRSLVPAPLFLTRLVRQAGLSDGTSESEQRIARRLLVAGAGTIAAGAVALVFALSRARRGA